MLLPLVLSMILNEQVDRNMVPSYLDAQIRPLIKGRAPADMTDAVRARLKDELLGALGLKPLPEKTPLNATVTGKLERDGYVIEKLVFEPLPKFYATAYLYIPTKGSGPFPAVVCPVGHWPQKKLQPVVQARCVGLALYGFVVLCIDMPGFYGPNDDERNFPGNHSDWNLHLASLPPLGPMVWDVVRGIDYLLTRPEVDGTRIGVTGASGGGMATMYAAAVDERVACYAPVCYAVSYEANYQNGCYCNHVPGVFGIGDRSDVMALAVPRPVLLIGAENDPEFPKSGLIRSHEKLSAFYEAVGKAEDCRMFVAPGGHDYSKPMRESMYGFFLKHLQGIGDGSPAPEPRELPAKDGDPIINVEDPKSSQSWCFPDGKAPADARSLRDLAKEKARRLANEAEVTGTGNLRNTLRSRLLRLYPSPERIPLQAEVTRETTPDGELFRGSFLSEPGLRIPFTLLRRPIGMQPVRIIFSEKGLTDTDAVPTERREQFAELRLDGRGFGSLPGLDMRLATYLGRPDVIMWAWDVSRAVDYLESRRDIDIEQIEVWGFGPAGGQVAYLAALLDPRIGRAYGQQTLRSYLDLFERDDFPGYAKPARMLEVADIPLMRKALHEDQ